MRGEDVYRSQVERVSTEWDQPQYLDPGSIQDKLLQAPARHGRDNGEGNGVQLLKDILIVVLAEMLLTF